MNNEEAIVNTMFLLSFMDEESRKDWLENIEDPKLKQQAVNLIKELEQIEEGEES